jgi:lipopolysaccharide/colanic/teichoic acid biosynthesis glycosyltransferase
VKSSGFTSVEKKENGGQAPGRNNAATDADCFLKPPPRWKRALDIFLGVTALVLLSPVWLGAILALLLSGSGPVLFGQTRVGFGEKTYTMFKFRTMHSLQPQNQPAGMLEREMFKRELSGDAVPESETRLFRVRQHPRVTPVGKFLRRFSIDELPQLINVLRGEMSLVGPRPALPWEVELFNAEHRRRHMVLPGMTGLWQVSGRNRLSSAQMLALDLEYIDRCSLKTDLKILFNTPRAAIWDRHTA